jgi:hypothetical protein
MDNCGESTIDNCSGQTNLISVSSVTSLPALGRASGSAVARMRALEDARAERGRGVLRVILFLSLLHTWSNRLLRTCRLLIVDRRLSIDNGESTTENLQKSSQPCLTVPLQRNNTLVSVVSVSSCSIHPAKGFVNMSQQRKQSRDSFPDGQLR